MWEQIGVIGIDAGLCWIGDPCYCVTPDCDEHPAESWSEFCDKIGDDHNHKQWNYERGHAGLGVTVGTGYGDGTYPVYVKKNRDGMVIEVKVCFDEGGR